MGSGDYLDSNWSAIRSFSVDLTHPLVSNIAPANGSIRTTKNVTIQWSSSDNNYITQQEMLLRFANGTQKVIQLSPSAGSYDLINLDDGLYSWQVKAVDVAGNSYTGAKWCFVVDTRLPYPPTLDSPANNSWLNTDRVLLSWHADDYDIVKTEITVQQVGGAYQYTKSFDSRNGSVELVFTQEGTYKWFVKAIDWANNQRQSGVFSFYVVIGSVSPYNLTATQDGYSFYLYNMGDGQTASYTISVYDQMGKVVFSKTGSVSLSAGERYRCAGAFTYPLPVGIYRMLVKATDAKGASKTNDTFFIVYSAGQRDWNNWASELCYLFQPVCFTRIYFEYGSAEIAHQVQLQFPSARSCSVFENTTKTKIECYASSSYVSFTALPRKEGESRVYFVSAVADPLQTKDEKIKDVIYQSVKAEEHLLRIKNQYPFDILKLVINGTGWLYSSMNATALKPLQEVNVTYYIPVNITKNISVAATETRTDLFIYVLLFMLLGVIIWVARGK